MLIELRLLLKACDIFSLSTASNAVESKILIHLGSVEIEETRG